MSESIGQFIDDLTGGKPYLLPVDKSNGGNESGASSPEILYGIDEPSTIKLGAAAAEPEPTADTGDGGEPRRTKSGAIDGRTLRRGPRGPRSQKPGTAAVIDFAGVLLGIHSMLATFTGAEEFSIHEDEAKELGDAIKTVLETRNVPINPETLAWINLGTATTKIYGTRLWAYALRTKGERQARKAAQPQQHQPEPAKVAQMPTPKTAKWEPPANLSPSSIWREPAL